LYRLLVFVASVGVRIWVRAVGEIAGSRESIPFGRAV
jgi:hypothetical protein